MSPSYFRNLSFSKRKSKQTNLKLNFPTSFLRLSPSRPPPLPNVDLDPAATHRPLATAAAVHALLRPFQLPQGDHAQLLLYVQGVSKRSKLDNVWVSLQLIFGPGWSSNQLYKNPNIA